VFYCVAQEAQLPERDRSTRNLVKFSKFVLCLTVDGLTRYGS